MILVLARKTVALRMAHFFIFLFHFFLSLIARKATMCGEKRKYLIVITFFGLYANNWRFLHFSLHVVQSCNEEVGFSNDQQERDSDDIMKFYHQIDCE